MVAYGRSDHDLVFSTRTDGALDAANVRREFKAACRAAQIGGHWTPRELRHSFVSLMSSSGYRSRKSPGWQATPTPGPPRWSTGES
jgi:integrase